MANKPPMIVFGPVPSRRLGNSLGINNIPPKTCSFGCVYCQVGRTTKMQTQPSAFYDPEVIRQAVAEKLAGDTTIDYLTFVADGEPTLDVNLGQEIALLKNLGCKVAVISNASLIDRIEVQNALALADWVSLKIDATDVSVWRRIDRPHGKLSLPAIQDGLTAFARRFTGELVTETMLVRGINDHPHSLAATAALIKRLKPARAYIAAPTRPPAESWVRPPDMQGLNRAYHIFSEQVDAVEFLIGYEGVHFAAGENFTADLLSITAVHPMREDAVAVLMEKTNGQPADIDELIAGGRLMRIDYQGERFYLRRFSRKPPNQAA